MELPRVMLGPEAALPAILVEAGCRLSSAVASGVLPVGTVGRKNVATSKTIGIHRVFDHRGQTTIGIHMFFDNDDEKLYEFIGFFEHGNEQNEVVWV